MLLENKIVQKTQALIQYMLGQKQDWCIELLLEINQIILVRLNDVVKVPLQTQTQEVLIKLIDEIFGNFDISVQLIGQQIDVNSNIQERAS